jgi:Leucine-rich repeat (LRR) protein
LDLSDNPNLIEIPQEIENLKALKTLRFNGNGISNLPYSLLHLRNLDTLELNKNKLIDFLPGVDLSLVVFESLTYLSLNGN